MISTTWVKYLKQSLLEWFSEKNIKFYNFDWQSQWLAFQNKKGWEDVKPKQWTFHWTHSFPWAVLS